jgi:hypothetical protein
MDSIEEMCITVLVKYVSTWYWRDVVIFNETLNNGVTVY